MCNCIEEMEEPLKGHNAALDIPFTTTGRGDRVVLATRKKDTKSRKPLLMLFATYCPFCGGKYE